jgi:hypothetical protein
MVKYTISEPAAVYTLHIQNRMDTALPYDITDIDPAVLPGSVPPQSSCTLRLNVTTSPVYDPCVKLLTLPYNYGRPVFVEFRSAAGGQQVIDLTEMPGFTMIENDDSADHIAEDGYHVKLYGTSTSNIRLDVWCE